MSKIHINLDITLIAMPLHSADPARSAFDEAIKFFNNNLTADDCKRIWLHDKICISDVEHAVLAAKTTYESRSQQSKARKWLTKLSQRLLHYGNIMDTLANYNPEYLALAWGAMKFLLMVRGLLAEYKGKDCTDKATRQ